MAILNERIKERRLQLGLTLLQVASQLNVKEATVQRYESGDIHNIKHDTIVKLSKVLMCSPEYLMGWSDSIVRPATLIDNGPEKSVIDLFMSLSQEKQKQAAEYLRFLSESEDRK